MLRDRAATIDLPALAAVMLLLPARFQNRNGEHQNISRVNVIEHDGNLFSAMPSADWIPAVISADTGIPLTQRVPQFVLTPGHPRAAF